MTTHSQGSYVAFRSERNAPTQKEIAARRRLAAEFKKYSEDDFPNGAKILFNGDGTPTEEFWKDWGTIEPSCEIYSFGTAGAP